MRLIAPGESIIFLRSERDLGVRNGTLAMVERVTPGHIDARLDDGRALSFDLKVYADIDHGYAATIHKAQGVTVDWAHVLATSGLDRHSSYVALSRHRDAVQPALAHHVHRFTPMGACLLINGPWYQWKFIILPGQLSAKINRLRFSVTPS